ncbi:MAG: hypothetical protein ABL904_19210 [Hyphomicrobiaceae bacterium]
MLSDDAYKTRYRATVASLEAWLDGLRRVADVETARDEVSWRVSVRPNVPEACPFELVLRADQHFDLSIGPETYEDQAIDTLDLFQPLLVAVTRGEVKTSCWLSAGTRTLVMVATRILPTGGKRWLRSRTIGAIGRASDTHLIRQDRHYVPYARGA